MDKFQLLKNSLKTVGRVQRMHYRLIPVRCIVAALNLVTRRFMTLSSSDYNDCMKQLFDYSLQVSAPSYILSVDLLICCVFSW